MSAQQELIESMRDEKVKMGDAIKSLLAINAELLEALEGMMKNHYEPHSQEWINAANAVAKARS